MQKLCVGVVGLGVMGCNHVRALLKNRNVKQVFVYDLNSKKLDHSIDYPEVSIVSNLDNLLHEVDAAIVCSSTMSHFEIAKKFILASIPVLVEKPVTATLKQASELRDISISKNVKLCVGHIERFNPTIIELKKLLDEMPPLALNMERLSYNTTRATDVSVILDLMLHDIDAAYYLLNGDIKYQYSHQSKNLTPVTDFCTALFTSGNIPITITASKISQVRKREIHVTCEEGFIVANLDRKEIQIHKNSITEYYAKNLNLGYKQSSLTETIFVPQIEPLVAEHDEFFKLVRGEQNSSVQINSAIDTFLLMECLA